MTATTNATFASAEIPSGTATLYSFHDNNIIISQKH